MVGNKANRLLTDIDVATQSATINLQRSRDETGIFHVDVTGTTIDLNVKIQGRPDDTAAWFTITNFLEGDLASGSSGGPAAAVVVLYPQMRINCSKFTGDPGLLLSAWLIE